MILKDAERIADLWAKKELLRDRSEQLYLRGDRASEVYSEAMSVIGREIEELVDKHKRK